VKKGLTYFDPAPFGETEIIHFRTLEFTDYEADCRGGQGFSTRLTGERGLWVAVLHRAVLDLTSRHERVREKARIFFNEETTPERLSVFEWIAEILLDMSASNIRLGLRRKDLL
jgi:hypothetical protein